MWSISSTDPPREAESAAWGWSGQAIFSFFREMGELGGACCRLRKSKAKQNKMHQISFRFVT